MEVGQFATVGVSLEDFVSGLVVGHETMKRFAVVYLEGCLNFVDIGCCVMCCLSHVLLFDERTVSLWVSSVDTQQSHAHC